MQVGEIAIAERQVLKLPRAEAGRDIRPVHLELRHIVGIYLDGLVGATGLHDGLQLTRGIRRNEEIGRFERLEPCVGHLHVICIRYEMVGGEFSTAVGGYRHRCALGGICHGNGRIGDGSAGGIQHGAEDCAVNRLAIAMRSSQAEHGKQSS